ncbi:2'-5' RNA ligase family protein [Pontivivens ytuae]|uniref:2'-5' RNA ligase family protein n=1 Tax=Pontivivens ytuae TaxID=2789856 RepID=A0A7S9QC50_9RHOB|nr:2'-5' RNA ligase family protein [Pontivivens ytuae]QPH53558.1 2'-5' RNA ligase family protein [Pontivivens ytuae]
MTDPLILTLALDEEAQGFFERERRRLFPPERNMIPAHLSLFHKLPGEEIATVSDRLSNVADRTSPLPLDVTGVMFLGRGSAYRVEGADEVRNELAAGWQNWLTPQDRQGFRCHVTVQNKVTGAEAKRTFTALQESFAPFSATGIGFDLWHYRGGPWEAAGHFPFQGAPT